MVSHFFQLRQFHLFMHKTCPVNFKEASVCVCVCFFVIGTNNTKMSHPGANPQVLYGGNRKLTAWEPNYSRRKLLFSWPETNLAAGYKTICWSWKVLHTVKPLFYRCSYIPNYWHIQWNNAEQGTFSSGLNLTEIPRTTLIKACAMLIKPLAKHTAIS